MADTLAIDLRKVQTRNGVWNRLHAQLVTLGEGKASLISHSETPWASITFNGTRHEIELMFDGAEAVEAGERFIEKLPDHEFAIAGQLVADATVRTTDHFFGEPESLRVVAVLLLLEED